MKFAVLLKGQQILPLSLPQLVYVNVSERKQKHWLEQNKNFKNMGN